MRLTTACCLLILTALTPPASGPAAATLVGSAGAQPALPEVTPALTFAVAQEAGVAELAWLVGEWQRETRSGMALERWRMTEAGLVGAGLQVRDGQERVFEALMIVAMAGDVYYIARPPENPYPVGFRLVSHDNDTWVFENTTHDFPQRIIYTRNGPDAMAASIEGPGEGGEIDRIEFSFTRR